MTDRDKIIEKIRARRAIYVRKRNACDLLDQAERHERMAHTVEAFDILLHEIGAE